MGLQRMEFHDPFLKIKEEIIEKEEEEMPIPEG